MAMFTLRGLQARLEELYFLQRRDIAAEIKVMESKVAAAKRDVFGGVPVNHQQGMISDEFRIRAIRPDVSVVPAQQGNPREKVRKDRPSNSSVRHLRKEDARVRVQR